MSMYKSSKSYGASGQSRHGGDKSGGGGRVHMLGTNLIDEEEFKYDHNQIYNDDSKFARQLKKLMREDEDDRKLQKIIDLSTYLDQQENIKFVLKLGKPSLNILLKILLEQQIDENKEMLVECLSKIGSIMINDRDSHKYFDWMFDKLSIYPTEAKEKNHREKDNLIKILLLDALQKNFKNENFSWYLKENIHDILNELKKLLETVDTPNLMMKLARTILQLSRTFSEAISRVFEDIVDILIAWHIDSSQADEIIDFTSAALIELRPFWLKKVHFTINLLEQFLEDMESHLNAYIEDVNKLKEIENIEKIAALFKIYNTVIKSISCIEDKNYKPLRYLLNANETTRMVASFNRLLMCLAKLYDSQYIEFLFGPANCLIYLFHEIFEEKIFLFDGLIIDYVTRQNSKLSVWSHEVDISYLKLLSKILTHYITKNNVELFQQLVSFNGRVWSYKFSSNPAVVSESLNIYKMLIVVKSIPIVQEVYKNLLIDAEMSFNTIVKYSNTNDLTNPAQTGSNDLDVNYDTKSGIELLDDLKYAETSLLFDLCVFGELGNAKNNLISMYAISPTLFELYTGKLSPCNWTLAEFYPNIQFAILNKFYSYCSRHDFFIANSSLFASKLDSNLFTNALTRDYFKIVIEHLTRIIAHPSTSFDLCVLALNWVLKQIDFISADYGSIFESELFVNLYNSIITIAYSNEDVGLICFRILNKTLNKFENFSESILNRVFDLCKFYMICPNRTIKDNYVKLLFSIPVNITLSQNLDVKALNSQDFSNFCSVARNNYTSSSSDCIISNQNFKTIMAYVLAGSLTQYEIYANTWLERIFYSCKRRFDEEKMFKENYMSKDSICIDALIENNTGILWFWALWECAQFCVQSKLKTPLGKAQDTFVAIESALKNYHNYETMPQSNVSNESKKDSWIDFSRLTLLLNFVEYLEKLIYNAYEGLAVGQQLTPKPVKAFFRTNKSTCNEWFWRVRLMIISLSCKSGHYEMAVRQSYEFIQHCVQHNLTTSNEFEQVLVLLVRSLIKLKAWQTLIGLHRWLDIKLKKTSSIDWILAAADETRGSLEKAVASYRNICKASLAETENKTPTSPGSHFKFATEKIFECYAQLHDWNEYLNWHAEYKASVLDRTVDGDNLIKQLQNQIDVNYIRAMASFESNDFESVKGYVNQVASSDDLLSSIECKWNIEQIEEACMKDIFKNAFQKKLNANVKTNSWEYLPNERMQVIDLDEMSYLNYEKLVLTQLAINLNESKPINFSTSKSIKLTSNKHNIKYLNYMLMLKETDVEFNYDFNLSCASLARKQGNLCLATRLTHRYVNHLAESVNSTSYLSTDASVYENFRPFMEEITCLASQITSPRTKLFMVDCVREASKLIYELGEDLNAMELLSHNLCSFADRYNRQATDGSYPQTRSPSMLITATQTITQQQQQQLNLAFNESLNEKHARSLITLTKWLISSPNVLKNVSLMLNNYQLMMGDSTLMDNRAELVARNIFKLLDMKKKGQLVASCKTHSPQSLVGDLFDLATFVSPKLAKSWFLLADWCYKSGIKDSRSDKSTDLKLNDDHLSRLVELIPVYASNEEKEFILRLFSQELLSASFINSAKSASKPQIHIENLCNQSLLLNRESLSMETKNLLVNNCKSLSPENIDCIWELYNSLVKKSLDYHKVSCNAYFTYLHLSDKGSNKIYVNENIIATLRILKLLVKYPIEMKDELQEHLSKTPTYPWKNIIPQLFCRLNHPESYIRQSLSELLYRIAKDFPHLIIYPAVVGCQDGPTKIETVHNSAKNKNLFNEPDSKSQPPAPPVQTPSTDSKAHNDLQSKLDNQLDSTVDNTTTTANPNSDNEPEINYGSGGLEQAAQNLNQDEPDADADEEETDEQEKQVELKNAYKYLLDTLTQTYPKTIEQVKLFVHEMRRITLLREELWLGTLNQIHSDITKRIEQLNGEMSRVNANTSLTTDERNTIIREKYEIVLQPIVTILEHVHEITLKLDAETPNEEQFKVEFAAKIADALAQLKDATSNGVKPSQAWSKFKHLHNVFYQRSQRHHSTSLSMDQISPKLAQLKATTIPIPGKDGQHCTIHSIANNILVLPTKTRPKKLFFIGSNGRRYPYLFKGLEDLHLDERIMQLLTIINTMFVKANRTESVQYHALNYSVTPLGPRSGLISWVEGATPLFTLYKRWQQREAIYQASKQPQQAPHQHQVQIPRPNDLYYNKLNPLLKEKGVKNFHENRADCPVGVLRQVLEELIKETPGDLLSKELWCNASTPGSWWKSVQIYARSTAVMSMIGYIIGLGDRHLDNVLVNLNTGEVAHIDYNICFEKGHNLRVPERVPFRMTQNLQHALGLTEIEGLFRLSCEHAMKTLRDGKETLLTLLEAFVYDPLLDWTGNDTGIIASFYGGGALAAAVSKTNNQENTTAQKYSKENRKNMEKKMTLRLYSIRLMENRGLIDSNKKSLLDVLRILLNVTNVICELMEKIEHKEKRIHLHEQAKIYLDESLTLHGKTTKTKQQAQHSVYSLHERYDQYAEFNRNAQTIFSQIDAQINTYKSLCNQHGRLVEFFKSDPMSESTNSNSKHRLLTQIGRYLGIETFESTVDDQLKPMSPMVSQFLQSIGQESALNQYESCTVDMEQLRLSRDQLIATVGDLIAAYSFIFRRCPDDIHLKSDYVKLLEWLQELRNGNSREPERHLGIPGDVYADVNANFNKLLGRVEPADIVAHKVAEFDSHMRTLETYLADLEARQLAVQMDNLNLDETMSGLMAFMDEQLSQCEGENVLFESFNFTLLQFLNDNLQKWMSMETMAFSSKEKLTQLTSREGDWYLEEMVSLIYNCNHLTRLIKTVYAKYATDYGPKITNRLLLSSLKCLDIFDNLSAVFRYFKELLLNFHSCIFDRLVDYSFSDMNLFTDVYNQLKEIAVDEFFTLIMADDFQQLTFLSNAKCMQKINEIKSKYTQLLTNTRNKICSMVLKEIEKLFFRVEIEFKKCVQFCKNNYLQQDPSYLHQTYFTLTQTLIYLFDENVYSLYSSIFMAKKIQTIQLCFGYCIQYYDYFFDHKNQNEFNIENFFIPIKSYISEFVVQMMSGIPTILIGNLLNVLKNDQSMMDKNSLELTIMGQNEYFNFLLGDKMMNGQINEFYFNTFNQIIIGYDTIWTTMDIYSRIESLINLNESYLSSLRSLKLTFEWLHEPSRAVVSELTGQKRGKLPIRLNDERPFEQAAQLAVSLANVNKTIKDLADRRSLLEATMKKRIEWASNTNPSLRETLRSFELTCRKNLILVESETKHYQFIEELLGSLASFECYRLDSSTQTQTARQTFKQLMTNIEDMHILDDSQVPRLSEVELNLVEFQSFKETKPLTASIIQDYYKLFLEELAQVKKLKQKEDKECATKLEELAKSLADLKSLLSQHNKLMNDIKPLLKTMSKYGDNHKLNEYSKNYHKFSEFCQLAIRQLSNNELVRLNMNTVKEELVTLVDIVPHIYDDLFSLNQFEPSPTATTEDSNGKSKKPELDSRDAANKNGKTLLKLNSRNSHLLAQECNSYAISVWKRVYQKLDGKDTEQGGEMNVKEQVDYLINQATDLNNLALLYEGWTPWV